MKKFLTSILSLTLVLTLFSPAYAKELKESGFEDTISSLRYGARFDGNNWDCSVKFEGDWVLLYGKKHKQSATKKEISEIPETLCAVVGYNGKDEVVSIPEELGGEKVTRLIDFQSANPIKTLKLHKGITEISAEGSYLSEDYPMILRIEAEIAEVVVDEGNETFASKDGVLYTKDIKELFYYPCAKEDKEFIAPDTVEYLSGLHFVKNPYLQTITVGKDNPKYSSKDGVLYNKEKTELIYYPIGKTDESFVIPDTVEVIGAEASLGFSKFSSGNKHLKNLTISKNVSSIGTGARTPLLDNLYYENNKLDADSFSEDEDGGIDIPLGANTVHCYKNSSIHEVYKEYAPSQNIKFLKDSNDVSSKVVSKTETSSQEIAEKPVASKIEASSNEVTEKLIASKTESKVTDELQQNENVSEILTIGTASVIEDEKNAESTESNTVSSKAPENETTTEVITPDNSVTQQDDDGSSNIWICIVLVAVLIGAVASVFIIKNRKK